MREKQRLCFNSTTGSGKVSYRTIAAARKIQKQSSVGLSIYGPCKFCGFYHLSSEEQRCKVIAPPSAAKLRRIIENAGREIAACEKRVRKADAELTRQTALAQERQSRAEAAHELEIRAIDAMINRLQR